MLCHFYSLSLSLAKALARKGWGLSEITYEKSGFSRLISFSHLWDRGHASRYISGPL
jgi:hypothetical protein